MLAAYAHRPSNTIDTIIQHQTESYTWRSYNSQVSLCIFYDRSVIRISLKILQARQMELHMEPVTQTQTKTVDVETTVYQD